MVERQQKFSVAICGGGIGGLCLAVALLRFPDIDVHVYEAASTFKEIGAGVMIWGRSWHILSLLGMQETLLKIVKEQADGEKEPDFGFDFRKSNQPEEGFSFFPLSLPHVLYLFHRAQFIDVLANRIPSHVAHLGKRLRSYTQDESAGPITLEFADGSVAACDVLLGCDGIKSTVRRQMYERKVASGFPDLQKHVDPYWSGWIAYRALVPAEKLSTEDGTKHTVFQRPMMYCGLYKHIVSYGIAQGKVANVVAMCYLPEGEDADGEDADLEYNGPWVSEASGQEVVAQFTGWEPEAMQLIQEIDIASKWALYHLHPLPTYVDQRVALLGDAAHAMTPHQGAGAGQAIEDAFVMAGILGHPSTTREKLTRALQAYELVRLPFANGILRGSYASGQMYEFWHDVRDDYEALKPAIEHQWDWVNRESPEEQLQMALRWMQRGGGDT